MGEELRLNQWSELEKEIEPIETVIPVDIKRKDAELIKKLEEVKETLSSLKYTSEATCLKLKNLSPKLRDFGAEDLESYCWRLVFEIEDNISPSRSLHEDNFTPYRMKVLKFLDNVKNRLELYEEDYLKVTKDIKQKEQKKELERYEKENPVLEPRTRELEDSNIQSYVTQEQKRGYRLELSAADKAWITGGIGGTISTICGYFFGIAKGSEMAKNVTLVGGAKAIPDYITSFGVTGATLGLLLGGGAITFLAYQFFNRLKKY